MNLISRDKALLGGRDRRSHHSIDDDKNNADLASFQSGTDEAPEQVDAAMTGLNANSFSSI